MRKVLFLILVFTIGLVKAQDTSVVYFEKFGYTDSVTITDDYLETKQIFDDLSTISGEAVWDLSGALFVDTNTVSYEALSFELKDTNYIDTVSFQYYTCGCAWGYSSGNFFEGDAHGTLILPHGTYENVVRIKQEIWDLGHGYDNTRSYAFRYYSPAHRAPILELYKWEKLYSEERADYRIRYIKETSSSHQEVAGQQVHCFPNPTLGKMAIVGLPNEGKVILSSAEGKQLKKFEITGHHVTVDLNALSVGVYFIQVMEHNGSVVHTEKVFINR